MVTETYHNGQKKEEGGILNDRKEGKQNYLNQIQNMKVDQVGHLFSNLCQMFLRQRQIIF